MKKISIRRLTTLSMTTLFMLTSSGCYFNSPTVPNMKDTKNEKLVKKEINSIKNRMNNSLPIERIYVKNYVYKKTNLNHEVPNIKLNINFSKGMTLKDFSRRIGLPSTVQPSIAQRNICFNGVLKGSLKSVLNTIASLTNTFWTYDRGVVKFTRTTEIIYSFPFFSMERLQAIYNTGSNSSDPLNVKIKNGVFSEIKKALKNSLNTISFSGNINEKWNENLGYINSGTEIKIKKHTDNNINKIDNLTNNKLNTLQNNAKKIEQSKNLINNKNEKQSTGSQLVEARGNRRNKNQNSIKLRPILKNANTINSEHSDTNNKIYNSNNQEIKSKKNLKTNKYTINKKRSELYNNDNKVNNKLKRERIRSINFTTKYGGETSKISISKELGLIFARLTPSQEKIATNIIKRVIQRHFSNLIVFNTFILSVNSTKVKNYSLKFGAIIQNGFMQSVLNIGSGGMNIKRDTLSLLQNGNPESGSILSGIINYFISNSNGEILSEPRIVTLSNVPARIKDSRYYPYLEPTQLTSSAGNSISYQIKNVEQGIDLTVLPTVLSDNTIVVSLGLSLNEYLGDKIVNAGILGTFNLPEQSPKKLNTTFRIKPGDLIILGGIRSSSKESLLDSQALVPTGNTKKRKSNDFIIVAMPRLIKFVQEKNRKKGEEEERQEIEKINKSKKTIFKNLDIKKIKDKKR